LEDLVVNRKTATDSDHMLLAIVYRRQGEASTGEARRAKLAAARKQYEALCLRSQPADTHLLLFGDFLLGQQLWPDADQILRRLEEMSGGDPRTISLRARWLAGQGRTNEIPAIAEAAAKRWEQQGNATPQHAQFFVAIGNVCLQSSLPAAAEPWFRKATDLDSKNYPLLATSLIGQGKTSEAVQLCLEEARKQANSPQAAGILATVLTAALSSIPPGDDDLRAAETFLANAVGAHPANGELLVQVAYVFLMRRRNDEAIQLYEQVLRLDPKSTGAMNNMALLLSERPGKISEALRYIDQAIQIAGARADLLDTKGAILIQQGRPDDALPLLQEAVAKHSADPRVHFHLAIALQRVGETESARTTLQTALDNDLRKQYLTESDRQLLDELEQSLKRETE
jgi:tetratricopeptide (TPR) repeat protein